MCSYGLKLMWGILKELLGQSLDLTYLNQYQKQSGIIALLNLHMHALQTHTHTHCPCCFHWPQSPHFHSIILFLTGVAGFGWSRGQLFDHSSLGPGQVGHPPLSKLAQTINTDIAHKTSIYHYTTGLYSEMLM